MKIVILSHPLFFGSFSMPRFANYLASGMKKLGHEVEIWRPKPVLSKIPVTGVAKKWLGYIDQYIIFSTLLFLKTHLTSKKRLYVISDQALGLWVPFISSKAHLVHCHDFLALKSAQGQIVNNQVGLTGRLYQTLILKGFRKAKNFISVSHNTYEELGTILNKKPEINTFVYNGLNELFTTGDQLVARKKLGQCIGRPLQNGFILHVGGNQFYKNRIGVIRIYNTWRNQTEMNIPLLLIGTPPTQLVKDYHNESKYKENIIFCSGLSDEMVKFAYQGASLFLFPSLAEGFGWPIAEAMACGCPVITTNKAPMNEVGGDAATYIDNADGFTNLDKWAEIASEKVERLLKLDNEKLNYLKQKGLENVKKFNSQRTISELNELYTKAFKLKYG